MNKNKYPTPYDIQEVLNSFSKRYFVDLFSQRRGVFYYNARQSDVAKSLSNILYEKKDIDELRASAYQTATKHTMSGFTLKSSSNFDLRELYERIRDNDRKIIEKGYTLHSLVKTSNNEKNKDVYKGSIKYKKKKPGRIEFLDEEIGYTEFYLIDLENGEWQVEVDGNKSTDGKAVLKLISNIIDKNSVDIFDINIDSLKLKSTIDFFDELAKVGLGNDWKFSDIKHLSFKRGRNLIEEDDDDSESVEKEQLTGISQAVLDGRNLRDDPFVLQYEKEGCIFSAMTYEFEHLNNPETIQLKAEFKGSPKIFEVSVVSYKITKGLDAKKENASLSEDDNRKVCSLFWNNAKAVYLQLVAEEENS